MSGSEGRLSRKGQKGQQDALPEPFIFRWCDKYGLADSTAAILMAEGFNSAAELLLISSEVIRELPLSTAQKLLFRGALLQFKEGDVLYAQRRARKYKIPVEEALFMSKQALINLSRNHDDGRTPPKGNVSIRGRILSGVVTRLKMQRTIVIRRDYLHYIRKYNRFEKRHRNMSVHCSPAFQDVALGDVVTVETLTPQEIDERLELRRRVRRKKNKGQTPKLSLAERIQNQRQNFISSQASTISGSKYSLASESSSTSYNTVRTEPIGHVTTVNQSDRRHTQSAVDASRKLSRDTMTQQEAGADAEDIEKDIEEILAGEAEVENHEENRSTERTTSKHGKEFHLTAKESAVKNPDVHPHKDHHVDSISTSRNAGAESRVKDNINPTPNTSQDGKPTQKIKIKDTDPKTSSQRSKEAKPPSQLRSSTSPHQVAEVEDGDDLINRMERQVDDLLRELTDEYKGKDKLSNNLKKDLKRANEIIDKELLTEEEKKMVSK